MTMSRMGRVIVPLAIVLAVAGFAFVWSYRFGTVPPFLAQGLQPAAFPRLVCILIAVLAAIAFVEDLRHPPEAGEPLPNVYRLTVLILTAFGALVAFGDFLLSLMIATGGIAALWGERRPLVLFCLAIIAPALVIYLFDIGFQVRFPRGVLLDLYYG